MVVVIAVITVVVSSRKACNSGICKGYIGCISEIGDNRCISGNSKMLTIVVYWYRGSSLLTSGGADTRGTLVGKWLEKCVSLLSES